MSVCARRRESFRFLEVNYCSKIIEFLSKIRGAISKAGYRIYIYIYIYNIRFNAYDSHERVENIQLSRRKVYAVERE